MSDAIRPLTMPKWGLAMKEATVLEWRVPEGGEVQPGDEVVDIETEKIAGSVEVREAGVLRRRIADEGQTLPVGALLAVFADPDTPDAEIDAFAADFQANFVPPDPDQTEEGEATQTVDAGGRSIRYLSRGEQGEAVVLVHGFGGDLNNWLFNHEPLAAAHRVYALDLPGHGGSAKDVGDGELEDFVGALDEFMAALEIDSAHLVGHSLGGAIALALTLAHPERTASLTLIGSAGLGAEIDGAYLDGFVQARRRREMKPHLEKLFSNPALITRQLIEDVLRFKGLDGVKDALAAVAGQVFPDGQQAIELRDQLGRVQVPLQVIWGGEDRIIPAAHAEGLAANAATHVVAGAGHMVQMEAPGEVNRLILALID